MDDNNWQPCFFEWWLTGEYKTKFSDESEKSRFIKNVKNAPKGEFKVETNDWIWNRCKWLKDVIGLKVKEKVREGDEVYKVLE